MKKNTAIAILSGLLADQIIPLPDPWKRGYMALLVAAGVFCVIAVAEETWKERHQDEGR